VSHLDRHNQGMLPRLRGVEIKEADEELALLLADQFYPELTHLDQIEDPQEKRGWITLAVQILRGQEAVIRHAAATFGEVFKPGVDAQVADTLRKSAAEEREREERREREIEKHKAELFQISQREDNLSGLRDQAIEQGLSQAETRESNGLRIENRLIWMMTTTFTLAVVLLVAGAVLTQLSDQPASLPGWAPLAGGSGCLALFSAITFALHRTRRTRMELDPLAELLALTPPSPKEAPSENDT
jgi:hypothetical protein